MTIIDERLAYQPFEYPDAYNFWEKQQQAHWLHTDASLSSSVTDWNSNLTEKEKSVITGILRGFTQAEISVGKYWGQKVTSWFPKPEITMMASTFAAFEGIHGKAYNYLTETLGLQDFDAFLQEDEAAAKLGYLISVPSNSLKERARSLAIYSAFMEGVSLFSSFAILLSFSMRNLLKGVGEIIKYSIRDEDIHSIAGIWLYNQLVFEYPEILDDELKADIYTGAEQVVKLEIAFLKSAFQQGEIEGVAEYDIEEFIKNRANGKLLDLNLKPIFTVDLEAVERIESWFLPLIGGASRTDGFATRVTEYAKSFEVDKIDWSLI